MTTFSRIFLWKVLSIFYLVFTFAFLGDILYFFQYPNLWKTDGTTIWESKPDTWSTEGIVHMGFSVVEFGGIWGILKVNKFAYQINRRPLPLIVRNHAANLLVQPVLRTCSLKTIKNVKYILLIENNRFLFYEWFCLFFSNRDFV